MTTEGLLMEGYWLTKGHSSFARLFYKNGTYYEGNIIQSIPNGKGSLYFKEKCVYSGNWLNGEYDGYGQLIVNDVCRYEGEFRNSCFHGKGELLYEPSDEIRLHYNGEFEDNMFHGNGKLQLFRSTTKNVEEYTGTWIRGSPNGTGSYTWPSGNKYYGNFESGKKNGIGKFTFNSSKDYYEGCWINGKPNGNGLLVLSIDNGNKNPAQILCYWRLGKAQKIEDVDEFSKINNDERKLNIPFENEVFVNGFSLYFEFLTNKEDIVIENIKKDAYESHNIFGKISFINSHCVFKSLRENDLLLKK